MSPIQKRGTRKGAAASRKKSKAPRRSPASKTGSKPKTKSKPKMKSKAKTKLKPKTKSKASAKSKAKKTTPKKAARKKVSREAAPTKRQAIVKKEETQKPAKTKPVAASAPRLKSAARKVRAARSAGTTVAASKPKRFAIPLVAPTSPLGTKYECFECSAKVYDLKRPEPTCPRCGADQRDRPAAPVPLALRTPRQRKKVNRMTPLLDEEEVVTTRSIDGEVEVPGRSRVATGEDGGFLDNADQAHDEDSEEP